MSDQKVSFKNDVVSVPKAIPDTREKNALSEKKGVTKRKEREADD